MIEWYVTEFITVINTWCFCTVANTSNLKEILGNYFPVTGAMVYTEVVKCVSLPGRPDSLTVVLLISSMSDLCFIKGPEEDKVCAWK